MQEPETTLADASYAEMPPEAAEQLRRWLKWQEIYDEFTQERQAQLAQWGDNPLPMGFGAHEYQVAADHYRTLCDQANVRHDVTHRDVLLEEFFEALAESDPQKARDELIQVGACVVKAIEDLDRKHIPEAASASA